MSLFIARILLVPTAGPYGILPASGIGMSRAILQWLLRFIMMWRVEGETMDNQNTEDDLDIY